MPHNPSTFAAFSMCFVSCIVIIHHDETQSYSKSVEELIKLDVCIINVFYWRPELYCARLSSPLSLRSPFPSQVRRTVAVFQLWPAGICRRKPLCHHPIPKSAAGGLGAACIRRAVGGKGGGWGGGLDRQGWYRHHAEIQGYKWRVMFVWLRHPSRVTINDRIRHDERVVL